MGRTQLTLFKTDSEETQTILKDDIPHIIKYMGSKKPIIDFVVSAIHEIHIPGNRVCDLFAGSCSISAALRKKYDFISNDVQDYSRILAQVYFSNLREYKFTELLSRINVMANDHVKWFKDNYDRFFFDYSKITSLQEYQEIELSQRNLLDNGIFNNDYYLFTKYYSGTYWSFEQCVWIDALRKVAEHFKEESIYYAIMASIMYSMSYTTQSTGHFAQYRDGSTEEAMQNIIYYRQKNLYDLFKKKLNEFINSLDVPAKALTTSTYSFEDCLKDIPERTTVYADPPYAPVHYSRFYHALETLVKYDYPSIDHKGRYRSDRHQSPFSQKSNALDAFETMFKGIIDKKSQMILSYSGSGVVAVNNIKKLAEEKFISNGYEVITRTLNHKHSTMGRFEDHERDVVEYLIIAKFNT